FRLACHDCSLRRWCQPARGLLRAWPPRRSRQSSAAARTDRAADVELCLQLRDLFLDFLFSLGAPLLVKPLPRRLLRFALRVLECGDLGFDVPQGPADDRAPEPFD